MSRQVNVDCDEVWGIEEWVGQVFLDDRRRYWDLVQRDMAQEVISLSDDEQESGMDEGEKE